MAYAAGQLLTTTRDIIEITMDCGIESLSYFYTLFRRTFGMTPRRYRLTYFKTPVKRLWPEA